MKLFTKRNQSGFTIIEVMIVLAIAGVIMLALFLAVPALQRNSRNNSYRNDAGKIAAAYAELSSARNGAVLSGAADQTAIITTANSKDLSVANLASGATAFTMAHGTRDTAYVRTGTRCPTTLPAAISSGTASVTPATSSTRSVSVYFWIELTGNQVQVACIEG